LTLLGKVLHQSLAAEALYGSALMEDILPYYAEDSLSAMFHDLLAELESGCKGDGAFYLSLLHTSPAKILEPDRLRLRLARCLSLLSVS
jgi:hypothetical protein